MQRSKYSMFWCDRASIAALVSLGLLAAGCTAGGSLGVPTTAAPEPAPSSSSSGSSSLTDKFKNFFSNSSADSHQAVAGAQADVNCPFIEVREGASTLKVGPTGENAAMLLKYQGTFVRAARECSVAAGNLVMRIGVEGRVIVGPAGGAGQVDVPLRIAVVYETPAGAKPIATKLVRFPVTIGPNDQNALFTHIEEGFAFPMPSAADLDHYTVYIGFDPLGAEAMDKQNRPPPAKPKIRPKPKPTANAN